LGVIYAPISDIEPSSSIISGEPELMQGEEPSKLKLYEFTSMNFGFSYIIPVPGSNSN
tara:strand:+ start:10329 stop:10502 length:174 start_codon:yes stop_codon:yes gene_type:complete